MADLRNSIDLVPHLMKLSICPKQQRRRRALLSCDYYYNVYNCNYYSHNCYFIITMLIHRNVNKKKNEDKNKNMNKDKTIERVVVELQSDCTRTAILTWCSHPRSAATTASRIRRTIRSENTRSPSLGPNDDCKDCNNSRSVHVNSASSASFSASALRTRSAHDQMIRSSQLFG